VSYGKKYLNDKMCKISNIRYDTAMREKAPAPAKYALYAFAVRSLRDKLLLGLRVRGAASEARGVLKVRAACSNLKKAKAKEG
jgi:hypothetical protein